MKGGQRPPPNHDPTKWSWFGEEEQGNGATDARQGVGSGVDFATTKEQGVSRMLTINLNDVEKELHIR